MCLTGPVLNAPKEPLPLGPPPTTHWAQVCHFVIESPPPPLAHLYTHTYTHTLTCMYVQIHIHTHTHTHMCTHTHAPPTPPPHPHTHKQKTTCVPSCARYAHRSETGTEDCASLDSEAVKNGPSPCQVEELTIASGFTIQCMSLAVTNCFHVPHTKLLDLKISQLRFLGAFGLVSLFNR